MVSVKRLSSADDFLGGSLCYIENEGEKTYYVQIVNPTDDQIASADSCRSAGSCLFEEVCSA